LAAAGVPLQLDCELPAPIRLRWREWLVRGVRRVTSHPATAGLLRIETPNGEQLLTRTAAPDFGGVVPVPLATLGCTTVQLIFPWAIESGVVLPAGARLSALPSNELTAMLQGGLGLLHNASPAYDAWCSRVLSDVFTLDGSDGATRSASDASVLGHVAVSAPASPLQIAELFVHESTHQYFHLAEQLGPLHDGSDAHLYYSPVKRCPRPIERILLAHHAFANILLFYRCVIERELDCTGDAQASFDRHARSLRQLELALDATQALTALGRALYLPYRDLIAM
jgi:HEXXH motif-containing protein